MSKIERIKLADTCVTWGVPPGIASIVFIILEFICRLSSFDFALCQTPREWAFLSVLIFGVLASPVAFISGVLLLANRHKTHIGLIIGVFFGIIAGVFLPISAIILHQKLM